MTATVALPTNDDLDMWPYVDDDSPLWSLDYAEQVSAALPDETTCYEQQIPWHEIQGWLFDLCIASYAYAVGSEDCENGSEILAQLDRMQFRMSPLFRDVDDLEEDVYNVYECLLARHQR